MPVMKCIHCDPSFIPTGPDDWCYCRCHETELEDPPADPGFEAFCVEESEL